jgi:hypothetical protein
MNEDETSSPQPAGAPPRLEYETPPDEALRRRRDHFDVGIGALLSAVATVGLVFLYIICNLRLHPNSPSSNVTVSFGIPLACSAAVVVLLGTFAHQRWVKRRSKAFALGLLIGHVFAILAEGLCFTAM